MVGGAGWGRVWTAGQESCAGWLITAFQGERASEQSCSPGVSIYLESNMPKVTQGHQGLGRYPSNNTRHFPLHHSSSGAKHLQNM